MNYIQFVLTQFDRLGLLKKKKKAKTSHASSEDPKKGVSSTVASAATAVAATVEKALESPETAPLVATAASAVVSANA